jgi:hypothetical protein
MTTSTAPRALFFFSAITYVREAEPLVHHFVEKGWQVRVVFGLSGKPVEDYAARLETRGVDVIVAPDEFGYGRIPSAQDAATQAGGAEPAPKSKYPSIIRALARQTGIARLLQVPRQLPRLFRIRRYGKVLLDDWRPSVVFQGTYHSVGQIDNALTGACKRYGIPVFGLPNSPYLGEKSLRVARQNHLKTGMAGDYLRVDYDLFSRILARLFPAWTRQLADGGTRVFYWDQTRMLSAWLSGLLINRPWLKPSLDFDDVFLFSQFTRSLLKDDYPAQRLHVYGQPLLDEFLPLIGTPEHAEAVSKATGAPVGQPFTLFNVEPAAEHLYRPWDQHRQDMRVMMQALKERGLPVVLSLHPLCHEQEYAFAETEFGAKICRDMRIHEIYAYCGISVSFPCSTNLLAEPFARPLVIYDLDGLISRDEESREMNWLPNAGIATKASELAEVLRNAPAVLPSTAAGNAQTACERIFHHVVVATGAGTDTSRPKHGTRSA